MKILISTLIIIPLFVFSAGPESTSETVAEEVTRQNTTLKLPVSTEKIPVVEEIETEVEVIRDQDKNEIEETPVPPAELKVTEKQGSRRSLNIYFSLLTGILLTVFAIASLIPPKAAKAD
jgi:hypothetical protein